MKSNRKSMISENELEIQFKEHIKECIDISNKLKKHKFYKEREMVVKWMFDICKEENIVEEIFIQSSNLFDKILIKFKDSNIMKIEYLQLIASACLLIISKLMWDKSSSSSSSSSSNDEELKLTIKKLIFYTDNTYTIDELCDMEMLLMINIDWNINDYYNIYTDLISTTISFNHHFNSDDKIKLNKIILNIFIFNNIFMLNYSIFNKNSSSSSFILLFYLISIKLFFNKKNENKIKKLINSNKYFISNIEDLILSNSSLFSFINDNHHHHQQLHDDEGFIEIDDKNIFISTHSDSDSSNSSGCFTKSSSTSSISSF